MTRPADVGRPGALERRHRPGEVARGQHRPRIAARDDRVACGPERAVEPAGDPAPGIGHAAHPRKTPPHERARGVALRAVGDDDLQRARVVLARAPIQAPRPASPPHRARARSPRRPASRAGSSPCAPLRSRPARPRHRGAAQGPAEPQALDRAQDPARDGESAQPRLEPHLQRAQSEPQARDPGAYRAPRRATAGQRTTPRRGHREHRAPVVEAVAGEVEVGGVERLDAAARRIVVPVRPGPLRPGARCADVVTPQREAGQAERLAQAIESPPRYARPGR